ncbi:hypothetical protein WICPIJ_004696 [Wickerhamomyces pijperi]|uniref:DUF4536 domain-containing protein n=1 Tax=Wickerhamomyces pijperi TaxID=599730 RepID=A0A9P8TMH7_WICPI|nr:hypothetical protein WICPIJ_004696 [Wickerhamomyces pijperi]
MSNIVNIFNPKPSRDLTPEEYADCLPCQIMATFGCITAGSYFLTDRLWNDPNISLKENLEKNPIWWRNSIKGLGVLLIGYGGYRGLEASWGWNQDQKTSTKLSEK